MTVLTYLFLVVVLALLLAGWMYYVPAKKVKKFLWVLFFLRFLATLGILLVLFNPKWNRNSLITQKPQLIVTVDNSSSIKSTNGIKELNEALSQIRQNKGLGDKFDIRYLRLGNQLQMLDSFSFNESETDFSNLTNYLKNLLNTEQNATILLTDGNQTKGSDYRYFYGKNSVFPIVIGDTTQYEDIRIGELNSNPYAFLDNTFPVEVFVHYVGKKAVNASVSIFGGNQSVFRKNIVLTPENNSHKINLNLPAKTVGTHYYTVVIDGIKDEKNKINNRKYFTIEVVDQQSKILIYSSFLHPDIGAVKESIESNKQQKVDLSLDLKNTIKLLDYQLVVLYQPNRDFTSVMRELDQLNKNTFIITGTQTDWNFLNQQQTCFSKKTTHLKEQFRGVYNANYPHFTLDDFALDQLPPLTDFFGELKIAVPYETVLFQKIGNTTLETPLLATLNHNQRKVTVLFGEGIWQWKLWSKKEKNSSEPFDSFLNAVTQYTAETKKAGQLQLDYEKMLFNNQSQMVKATFTDQNYKIDTRANLTLQLTHIASRQTLKLPMALKENNYEATLQDLQTGDYIFTVLVDGKNIQKQGNFKVLDYSIEEQFVSSDYQKLNTLAINNNGQIYFPDTVQNLIDKLLQDNHYKNIQKTIKKSTPLIDWKWLLVIIIVSLSAEWFIRKYRGMI